MHAVLYLESWTGQKSISHLHKVFLELQKEKDWSIGSLGQRAGSAGKIAHSQAWQPEFDPMD